MTMLAVAKALAAAQVHTPEIVTELTRAFDRGDIRRMNCLLEAMRLTGDLLEAIVKAVDAEIKANPALGQGVEPATKPILRVVE